jgi:mannosyltransferase OCH1-like enzyme
MPIPKVVYQTFKHQNLPLITRLFIKWLKWVNKDYRYEFYDDTRIEAFLKSDFGDEVLAAYKKIDIGAAKADFFRYCILYKKGGIYLDIDAYVLKPLDKFIKPDDVALISREGHPGMFVQWALIYEAGHPFLKDTIEHVLENIRYNKYPNDVHQMTGPTAYSTIINHYVDNKLPVSYRLMGTDYNGLIKSRLPLSRLLYRNEKSEHWKKAQLTRGVLKDPTQPSPEERA